ncbi:MAG: DUF190 domain-containing protein [Symbiobacteriia bacterium]
MQYAMIEILTNELAHHGVEPVYMAVIQCIRAHRVAARVHVYRGMGAVYEGGEFSSANLIDISANLPIKIEVVLPEAEVDNVMPRLAAVVTEGVIAVRPLDVRHHQPHRGLLPRDLRVTDVMTPNPVTIAAGASVLMAVRILMTNRFKGLPVVDQDDRLLGIVTEEDLIERAGLPVRPELLAALGDATDLSKPEAERLSHLAVREVMTPAVETMATSASAIQAAHRMVQSQHRTLPVVDGHRVVGMISRLDVLRAAGQWTHSLEEWAASGTPPRDGSELVRNFVAGQDRHVSPGASLREVGQAVLQTGIRRVAVVDEAGKLVGVVAESDLLRALAPERTGLWDYLVRRLSGPQVRQLHPSFPRSLRAQTAAQAMTTGVVTAGENEPLADAITRMMDRGLKEMPVVDGAGRFLGFLSRPGLMRAIVRSAPQPS